MDILSVTNRQNATAVDQNQFFQRPGGSIDSVKTVDGGLNIPPSFGVKLEF